jgi:hypothetical protein
LLHEHAVSRLLKEETDGTIEYLYAKAVSRLDIFAQKLAAIVLSLRLPAGFINERIFSFRSSAYQQLSVGEAIVKHVRNFTR